MTTTAGWTSCSRGMARDQGPDSGGTRAAGSPTGPPAARPPSREHPHAPPAPPPRHSHGPHDLRGTPLAGSRLAPAAPPARRPVAGGCGAWGDYDTDGRLDSLLNGSGSSQLWRNPGAGFSNVTASVAPGLPT